MKFNVRKHKIGHVILCNIHFLPYHLKEWEYIPDSLGSSRDSYHRKRWPSWGNLWEWEKKKGHTLFIPLQRNDEDSELPGHTGYVVTLLPEADQLQIIATTDEAAEAKEETLRSHTHEVCQTFQPSATILRKGDIRPLTPNIPLSKMWIFPEFKAYLPLKPKPLPVLYLEHNGSWGYSLMLECWDTGFNSHPH